MVEAAWKADIESNLSTKYLNPLVLNVGSSHHIWSTLRDNIHDSRRAQIKYKILTRCAYFVKLIFGEMNLEY